ncbi:MAG: LuxR C-terminal-related transcriptional regulator, partial [Eubacteriaceae bacterium]|nr:LuxR C-terminal-related transcriptional regulator [Eubacteriaceae bacterium]
IIEKDNRESNTDENTIPVLRNAAFHRKKIESLCNKTSQKIIYIQADTGWGKTTALSLWAEGIKESVYWLTLQQEHNQWSRLRPALEQALMALENKPSPVVTLFEKNKRVCDDKEDHFSWKKRRIVILDDFYHITDPQTLEHVADFFENGPEPVQFIVLGRQPLPQTLQSFHIQGQLCLMTHENLCFDQEETQKYLKRQGCIVSIEALQDIQRVSEGWPPFINAIALEISQNNGKMIDGEGYHYARGMLNGLVEEKVLNFLDGELKACVLLLSFLDCFSIYEGKALTGMDQLPELLNRLLKQSSVIQKTGKHRYSFQSNVYGNITEIREIRVPGSQRDAACKRIGRYYENQGYTQKALQFYFKRDIYPECVRVIKDLLKKAPVDRSYYAIEDYLKQLPEAMIKEEPLLVGGKAMSAVLNDRVEESKYWYQVLINMRKTLPRTVQKKEKLEGIIAHAKIALPTVCDDKSLIAIVGSCVKVCINSGFEFYPFSITGNQPRIMAGSRDFSNWTFHTGILKKFLSKPLEFILGKKAGAVISTGIAEKYYQYDQLSQCMIDVSEALTKSRKVQALDILFVDQAIIAQIQQANGEMARARETISRLKVQLTRANELELLVNVRAFSALQDLLEGKNKEALEWAQNCTPDENQRFRVIDRYVYLIKIRVYLCNDLFTRALPLIDLLNHYAVDYSRTYNIIETLILKAICLDQMQEENMAKETMLQAIQLAEDYNFVRVFADEGDGCGAVLEKIEKDNTIPGSVFFSRILAATQAFYRKHPNYYKKKQDHKGTLLTRSEQNVLEEMAGGKTNAELARTLGITVATVKTHINRIFSKLEVSNRVQALIKAQELGIIELITKNQP